ncbi:hypothetical protein B9G69_012775 [Bdellovibrio sp. SKB1291214]|uniref:hypothetical protein n=1 Tax=Bdellovibrio sp. SKB1291214 TaxID=1732569 RepID=UPI000B516DFB|nr:hypothetical protein [Bdellovibrio sp. SKB1291214]UYL07921.1 hypothetical protein B9G69_012775 [Bdellovibrio sp. SKB1291214]
MTKKVILTIIGTAVGFMTGLILGFALTPILWKLEPVLGLELAGHSGPSTWVAVFFGIVIASITGSFAWKRP